MAPAVVGWLRVLPAHVTHEQTRVNGMSTEVLRWTAEEAAAPRLTPPVYFIMIPGNPGSVHFYVRYLDALYRRSNSRLNIVCVGHASHSVHSASGERYNLQQQVAHKVAFVQRLLQDVSPGAQLVLAGHSVGAYMAVEVLRSVPVTSLHKCILLFPTLMHIGRTVNGTSMMPLFRYFRPVATFATRVLSWLPAPLQRAVLRVGIPEPDDAAMAAGMSLLHPNVTANTLWMALHEMNEILHMDEAHFDAVQHKCVAYFAEQDGWVNPADVDFMEGRFSSARVIRCEEGHKHAFVLSPNSSSRLAELTWSWLELDGAASASAGGGDVPAAQAQHTVLAGGSTDTLDLDASTSLASALPASAHDDTCAMPPISWQPPPSGESTVSEDHSGVHAPAAAAAALPKEAAAPAAVQHTSSVAEEDAHV
ncbi:MAG: hypothetical protein EOO41_04350, partial [Methanobacteriota archaeon]